MSTIAEIMNLPIGEHSIKCSCGRYNAVLQVSVLPDYTSWACAACGVRGRQYHSWWRTAELTFWKQGV